MLVGVNITLPVAINVTEGDTYEVCAYFMPATREREIALTFTIVPSSEFAGIELLMI